MRLRALTHPRVCVLVYVLILRSLDFAQVRICAFVCSGPWRLSRPAGALAGSGPPVPPCGSLPPPPAPSHRAGRVRPCAGRSAAQRWLCAQRALPIHGLRVSCAQVPLVAADGHRQLCPVAARLAGASEQRALAGYVLRRRDDRVAVQRRHRAGARRAGGPRPGGRLGGRGTGRLDGWGSWRAVRRTGELPGWEQPEPVHRRRPPRWASWRPRRREPARWRRGRGDSAGHPHRVPALRASDARTVRGQGLPLMPAPAAVAPHRRPGQRRVIRGRQVPRSLPLLRPAHVALDPAARASGARTTDRRAVGHRAAAADHLHRRRTHLTPLRSSDTPTRPPFSRHGRQVGPSSRAGARGGPRWLPPGTPPAARAERGCVEPLFPRPRAARYPAM